MSTTIDDGSNVLSESDELEETARITRDLIRIETTNYGSGKSKGATEAAEYVEAYLSTLGISSQLVDSEPRRTRLVTRSEGRDSSKPARAEHGHLRVGPA